MIYIKLLLFLIIFLLNFTSAYAKDDDYSELLPVIKACADIGSFNSESYDTDELMRRVLYTYRNFEIITAASPDAQISDNLKMCKSEFIKEAVYNAFRITAPSPEPHKLTELGYCENNGYYYFSGGYTKYFATDVQEILKVIPLDDGSIYVIFSNTYREGSDEPSQEYSSVRLIKDNLGYYVLSINMGGDFSELNSLIYPEPGDEQEYDILQYMPLIVAFITLASSGIVLYFFIIRR